jgi:thiol-disulfide isomerase/thioredoxin
MRTGLIILMIACALPLRAEDPEPLEIGTPAPDFSLPGIDGKLYSLASFKDARVLSIFFTANHCPTAQAYEERLRKLSESYTPDQMQVVAISSNHPGAVCLEEMGYTDLGDSFEEMKIRAKDKSYNYPYLYDGDEQAAALAYGAVATPHVFIFDRDRKLRYRGRVDDMEDPYQAPSRNDAHNAIEALLAGKPVPVETTRAFGCSIKWKSKIAWRQQLDEQWAEKPVELKDIDTPEMEELLANGDGNLRLVNLWATWCGPCIIEFPQLVELQRMYGQRHFEVVTISLDRDNMRPDVLEFLDGREAAVVNYLFTGQDREPFFELIDPRWQGNIPYTMIIKPGGDVIYRHTGIIDPLEVKKVIIGELGRYFADD